MRYRIEFAFVQAVSGCLRFMPMTLVRACGGGLGRLVSSADFFHRRIALENLKRAFPSRAESDLRKVSRAMFAHFGRLLLELIKFGTLSADEILARVEIEGQEHVTQAYRQGKGVLYFTGHFGYWEIQAIAFALHAEPISVVARPVDNPYLHAMLERIRTCTGNAVIYRQGGLRRVLRDLQSNRGVAMLIDQHLHSDAVSVEFFNRPAATTTALAALALRTGAPVIPVFALPLPGGRYRLIYDRPVPPPGTKGPEAIREFTQRCTDVLEMYVRRDPQFWLWMHRRWRDAETCSHRADVMTKPEVERLLVVSPNWLGDAVMALPAIGDLRRGFPQARLTVAARPAVAGLFAMSPLVDDVTVMQWSGKVWARRSRQSDIAALRALRADVSVLLPNSFASAWLVSRAGVPQRWGYATDLRGRLLTRAIARPAIRAHQSEYYRRLVKALGVENGPVEPELVVPRPTIERAREILRAAGWDERRRLVVMAPGAAYGGAKRWPAEHFADVAAGLVREQRVQCVLIGSAADAPTTRWVRAIAPDDVRAAVMDLAGATALDTLMGILSLASACVSNDSGAMHVAGAVGVPLAALFGPTRERETAPLSGRVGRVEVLINHVWCRPCMLRECPLDHRCMKGLSPDRVLAAVTDLMTHPESSQRGPKTGARLRP